MVETFDSLINQHQNLVLAISRNIYRRLPRHIAYEDVLSYGQLGLTQAARTYQPVAGAEFATYAHYRITGAIYDGLARMNWTSRAEIRRQRAMQASAALMEERANEEPPTDTESQARSFFETVESLSTVYCFSALSADSAFEDAVDGEMENPSEQASENELKAVLREAIATLSPTEQSLIQMTYFENLSLAEAASKLGKSRSWGCRNHARILKKLSGFFAGASPNANS